MQHAILTAVCCIRTSALYTHLIQHINIKQANSDKQTWKKITAETVLSANAE